MRRSIYKQLDDYRSGKRLWGVMGALAKALSAQRLGRRCRLFCRPGGRAAGAERKPCSRVRAQPEGKRSGEAPGICRRSATRHPALLSLSRSRRFQNRSSGVAGTACRLHRTAARGLRPRHSPERHLSSRCERPPSSSRPTKCTRSPPSTARAPAPEQRRALRRGNASDGCLCPRLSREGETRHAYIRCTWTCSCGSRSPRFGRAREVPREDRTRKPKNFRWSQ